MNNNVETAQYVKLMLFHQNMKTKNNVQYADKIINILMAIHVLNHVNNNLTNLLNIILKNAFHNVHKIKFGVLLKMNKNAEINKIVMMTNIK